jgi:hypothetical protein
VVVIVRRESVSGRNRCRVPWREQLFPIFEYPYLQKTGIRVSFLTIFSFLQKFLGQSLGIFLIAKNNMSLDPDYSTLL